MKLSFRTKYFGNKGFTLAELMVATFVMVVGFVGLLTTFIRCIELNEISRNSSIAVAAVKTQMEQIKNTNPPANMIAAFNAVPFAVNGLTGMGVSYVNNTTDPNLYEITVTVCWQQKNGRIFGEDTNLNGVLNAGEDANANGILDSAVQVVTFVYDG